MSYRECQEELQFIPAQLKVREISQELAIATFTVTLMPLHKPVELITTQDFICGDMTVDLLVTYWQTNELADVAAPPVECAHQSLA